MISESRISLTAHADEYKYNADLSTVCRLCRKIFFENWSVFNYYWATLTVGLASHWPCITSGLSTYGLNGHGKGDEHRAYALEGHGTLYFTLL